MSAHKLAKTDDSFVILRLANKITFPHQLAALLVLRVLAKCAKSSGHCYPGYALISALCGGIANSTIADSLQYIYSLHLLTLVKHGHGNQYDKYCASNVYKFNISAMRALVTHQGLFSPNDDNNKCLLHGKALTARVKLLSSLTLPSSSSPTLLSEPFAELPEPFGELREDSAELSEQSAELSERRLTSSTTQLSAKATPSENQLPGNPPRLDSSLSGSAQGFGCGQPFAPAEAPQLVRELSSPTLPSKNAQVCAPILPRGYRPEREVVYLEDQ
jgi:hypothetical protein